ELAAPLEELKHAHCSVGTLEAVAPGDLMHRLAPSRGCELVALTRVGLLLGQQLIVRTLPILLRNDLGKIHRASFVASNKTTLSPALSDCHGHGWLAPSTVWLPHGLSVLRRTGEAGGQPFDPFALRLSSLRPMNEHHWRPSAASPARNRRRVLKS